MQGSKRKQAVEAGFNEFLWSDSVFRLNEVGYIYEETNTFLLFLNRVVEIFLRADYSQC